MKFFLLLLIIFSSGCTGINIPIFVGVSGHSPKIDYFKKSVVFEYKALSENPSELIFYRSNTFTGSARAIILYANDKKVAAISSGDTLNIKLDPGKYILLIKDTLTINSACLQEPSCMTKYADKNVGVLPPESSWVTKKSTEKINAYFKAGETYYIYYKAGVFSDKFSFVSKEKIDKIRELENIDE